MKKFVSILLAVLLVASLVVTVSAYSVYTDDFTTTSDDAIAAYEAENGVTVNTRKYLFQMPNGKNGPVATDDVVYTKVDEETGETTTTLVCKAGEHAPSWFNEFTEGAGVYWWGSAEAGPTGWAGYRTLVEDADQCIFYSNVPRKAVVFIFNNGIDGGQTPTPGVDPADDIYYKAAQTSDIACEYPDPGEVASMPEGSPEEIGFDNCIFIIDPDKVEMNPFSLKMTCGGTWYFYYGNGCYGSYATDSDNFVSVEANCVNPDHFDAEGNHVGFHASEEPTEPAVEPTEPAGDVLRGDYDGDGQITIMDATRVQNILAQYKERPSEDFLKAVDADGDGNLTIMDATRIQNVLAYIKNMDGTDYVA